MATMKQKDAVYSAITNVVGNSNQEKVSLTKDQFNAIASNLATGIMDGAVPYKKGAAQPDIKTATIYAKGVIKNWLKRDVRLNGGIKNPIVKSRNTQNLGKAGLPEEVQAIFKDAGESK